MMTRGRSLPVVLLILLTACAKTPPSLSPPGRAAFHAHRIGTALSGLQDAAIAAHAQVPPILSEQDTGRVVRFVVSTTKTLDVWVQQGGGVSAQSLAATVQAGLNELEQQLPAATQAKLKPYLDVIEIILREVGQ